MKKGHGVAYQTCNLGFDDGPVPIGHLVLAVKSLSYKRQLSACDHPRIFTEKVSFPGVINVRAYE